ncbi:helix-turn-helix domain-containing protein [Kitasatospora cathayae]|uniref:Helix-turn-helix transcriptional regulator n=1 Tax=Kitasatospora cathayae TaxID=3004092 RepID=A0ABY7Q2U4_9ACTN|nr:helix-turn-helix transcriptional regulator [Kitasatospora sp. HUAS 3-15]WBP87013.1 helix-turn-helix transcriptional regulator [Kitasatospora sp. HUAS 3-15]
MNVKPLTPDSSPQASFGAQLRAKREELGLTQDQVAERTGYSPGHISSVETGRKPPTLRFARQVDRMFGTGTKFANLFLDVRASSLLQGFAQYLAEEAKAVEIRCFEVGIIPGLLQTPEYAAELAAAALSRGAIAQAQADERLKILASRQRLFTRTPPPQLFAILDESCIRRPIGTPATMDAQLEHLMSVAALPNVTLQVAPYSMGAVRSLDLPVYLLGLRDHSITAYSESAQQGSYERDPEAVRPLLTAYHHLQVEALPQAASTALISKVREEIQ